VLAGRHSYSAWEVLTHTEETRAEGTRAGETRAEGSDGVSTLSHVTCDVTTGGLAQGATYVVP